ILAEHPTKWNLSFQKKHGFVWWVNTLELKTLQVTIPSTGKELTTAELLSRKLFDMASHPENPNFQVASSRGVFLTENGQTWQSIDQFKKNNLPVVFSSKGTLFVGAYRSEDNGRTFTPILRWDHVASQVINTTRNSPSSLRILELD